MPRKSAVRIARELRIATEAEAEALRLAATEQAQPLHEEAASLLDEADRITDAADQAATAALARARKLEVSTQRANQRTRSLMDVLDFEHGIQGRNDPAVVSVFAGQVYRAIWWGLEVAHYGYDARRREAAAQLQSIFPTVPTDLVAHLTSLPWSELKQDNAEAGRAIGLRLDTWEAVRSSPHGEARSLQLVPAFRADGSELPLEEFRAHVAELKRLAQAQRRRDAGARTQEERDAVRAADRAVWAALAASLDIKPDTAKRWAKAGRIEYPPGLSSGSIRDRVPIQKEGNSLYQHGTSDERDGGPSGAAVTRSNPDVTARAAGAIFQLIDRASAPAAIIRASIDRVALPTTKALTRLHQTRQGGSAEGRPTPIPTPARLSASNTKG